MIRYLADIATPLHVVVHKTPFQWSIIEQEAYDCLKKMLTKVPVIQLDKGLSYVCRCIGYHHWMCVDATLRAQLVGSGEAASAEEIT